MPQLTEGSQIHFVLKNGDHRPAVVVNAWREKSQYVMEERVNLAVVLDGTNDAAEFDGMVGWRTTVFHSEEKEPGTWHWPEAD